MNSKITFPELVDTIAELTNTSKRVSELFLKELFGIIKERLEQGENVKIKNLGTFKVVEIASRKSVNVNSGEEMEIPAHRRVSFTPDKSLAEAINAPFEEFETVMLDDDLTEEELQELSKTDITDSEPVPSQEPVSEAEEEPQPPMFTHKEECAEENDEEVKPIAEDPIVEQVEVVEVNEMPESEPVVEEKNEPADVTTITEPVTESQLPVVVETSYMADEYYEEVQREKRKSFIWGLLVGLIAVVAVGYVAVKYNYLEFNVNKDITSIESAMPEEEADLATIIDTDSVPGVETIAPQPVVVTDTVRTNYYLTKMSRKHYGRYEFWVYIYEENKDKIDNPNSVPPGMVVVIPPAEKYGIDKNNPESVRIANEKAKQF